MFCETVPITRFISITLPLSYLLHSLSPAWSQFRASWKELLILWYRPFNPCSINSTPTHTFSKLVPWRCGYHSRILLTIISCLQIGFSLTARKSQLNVHLDILRLCLYLWKFPLPDHIKYVCLSLDCLLNPCASFPRLTASWSRFVKTIWMSWHCPFNPRAFFPFLTNSWSQLTDMWISWHCPFNPRAFPPAWPPWLKPVCNENLYIVIVTLSL
jgi:hypothetical protein